MPDSIFKTFDPKTISTPVTKIGETRVKAMKKDGTFVFLNFAEAIFPPVGTSLYFPTLGNRLTMVKPPEIVVEKSGEVVVTLDFIE